jgi:predicted metalloprotease
MLLPMILSRFGIGGVVVLGVLFPAVRRARGGGSAWRRSVRRRSGGPGASGGQGFRRRRPVRGAGVVTSTEQEWGRIFADQGERYAPPQVALFTGRVRSACGAASSASGPVLYCPADRTVYPGHQLLDELSRRFGAPGDFAAAYVIAHEWATMCRR